MNRIIACLLAALLLVSTSVPTAVAATDDEPTFTVSSEQAYPGQNISVTIRVDHNPGIASIKLKAQFNADLTLNSITYNRELGGRSQQPETFTSPVTLNWFNGDADTTGDMDYAVLNFTVSQTASAGMHSVTVTYDEDDVYNIAGDNIAFHIVNGGVNVTYIVGDTDLNGIVEIVDATWIQRHILHLSVPFPFITGPADVDGNGDANITDASLIQYYLAHAENPLADNPLDIGKPIK